MNEETLFQQALELPLEQRESFLQQACSDPELRARVSQLLAADAKVSPQGGIGIAEPDATRDSAPRPGDSVGETSSFVVAHEQPTLIAGRYRLLQQIGEGGMGTVWMAEQTTPVKRKVAVKLIRVDRAQSKTVLARFEAERQAIALMDHPHIARLLDAGTTEEGTPYFVMELVKGIALDEYCDQQRLDVKDRLKLFVQICDAIQHAHQKGIIHRDLKPSNILVESHDGKPVPKIIDFGLAKAISGLPLTEQPLFTAFGSVLGTPLYMAPEQAAFNAVDVDTRADVYALGVILYELLTGSTPITRESMKKAALDEVFRLIREQEAPTPSSRLSQSESMPSVAACRQVSPDRLGRLVRGELDWIVLKALSKERDRRYESATGFARDIERFLNHEPVLAGPPSRIYKVQKFIRRYRYPVTAALLMLVVLIAGVIGTTWGMMKANRAAKAEHEAKLLAEQAADKERQAREVSEAQLEQIALINRTVFDIFQEFDIRKVKQSREPVEAVLANRLIEAGRKLDAKSIPDPFVLSDLRHRLGRTLTSLGKPAEAVEFLEQAQQDFDRLQGADEVKGLIISHNLARAYVVIGDYNRAVSMFESILVALREKLGADHPETLACLGNLADASRMAGKMNQAVTLCEEHLERLSAIHPADNILVLLAMNNLGTCYQMTGKLEQARDLFSRALELKKVKLGETHSDTLTCMNNLGNTYRLQGKVDEAISLFRELLQLRINASGPEHPLTLGTMNNLAVALKNAGQTQSAMALLEQTVTLRSKVLGDKHPETLTSKLNLASCHVDLQQAEKAIPVFDEILNHQIEKLGASHPSTIVTKSNLAKAYFETRQAEQATAMYLDVVNARREATGGNKAQFAGELAIIAWDLFELEQYSVAELLMRECLTIRTAELSDDWRTFNTQSMLGEVLLAQKKFADAEPLLKSGYEGLRKLADTLSPELLVRITEARDRLASLYRQTDREAEAEKLYQETE